MNFVYLFKPKMTLELLFSGRMLALGPGFDLQYCKTKLYKTARGNKGSY